MQPTKLYIGIILGYHWENSELDADVVSTGTDYDQVYKRTREIWEEQCEKGDTDSHVNTDFVVKEAPMPTLTPTKTSLPEWYKKATEIASTEMIASYVLDRWDNRTRLYEVALWDKSKYYEDPRNLEYDLENGDIIPELEKDSNGEYAPEYLKELAETFNRKVQDYKDNDKLVILDSLKANQNYL